MGGGDGGGRRPRLYYGWVVVAVAFVTMAVAISARTGYSLLLPQIIDEFGWSSGLTAGAFSLGFLASTAFLPALGWMMDRWGPRAAIPIGATAVAAGYALAVLIETPFGLYAAFGLMVVSGSMAMSYIGHSMFLPNWFVRNRGLAIGIAFAGVGAGGIVLLPLMQWVIDGYGWRTACLAMAGLVAVAIVPLNIVFQRRRPQDLGLEPDGDPAPESAAGRAPAPDAVVDAAWAGRDWTLREALRTRRFWLVSLGYFCGLFAWYGIQVHQTRYLIEIGFSTEIAALALGGVAFFGIFGQIGLGAWSDRFGREAAWTIGLLGYVGAALLLIALGRAPSMALLWAMVIAQGLLGNGLASIFGAIPAEIFAGRRFASIFSVISLSANVGAAAGAWAMGALRDAQGDYVAGFWLIAALSVVSMAAIWAAAPRRVRLVAGQARRRAARG